MTNDSQLKILYLYQILLRHSDAEHPLSTNELIEMMETYHQIKIHRTTVARYIAELNAGGVEIMEIHSRNNQYYLNERTFELAELKLLVDAVESSRFIPEKKSQELVGKLIAMASEADAEKLERNVYTADKVKTLNQKILYIIDVIHEAINSGRRISFQYADYDIEKHLVPRNGGKAYILSPYSLMWQDDNYYLVGYNHGKEHIETFRVDRIMNTPEILEDAADPLLADFDISEYSSKVFQMYDTDQVITVTLLCENELMKHVIDRFGIEVDTHVVDDQHFEARVSVCTSPNFYRWVFGWCGKMKITGPPETLAEYRHMAEMALR